MRKPYFLAVAMLVCVLPLKSQETESHDNTSIAELNPDLLRITLLPSGPKIYRSSFVQRYEMDTLWLSAGISGKPALLIAPFPAEQIIDLRLPVGVKKRSRILRGGLLGLGIGLAVGGGIALANDCPSGQGIWSAFCGPAELILVGYTSVGGLLIGGIIGLISPSKRKARYETFTINGRPEALRAQRQRLQELSRWQ